MHTLPALLTARARSDGSRTAIEDGPVRLSFAELEASALDVTRALLREGIRPGDRVAIQAPNRWEWIAAALGAHGAGAVLVPLNTRFRGEETASILSRSRARLLFATRGFLGTDYLAAIAGFDLPELRTRVALEDWDAFLVGGPADARAAWSAVRPEDVSDILYTSGTTGLPKGVPTTHAQTLRVFGEWASIAGLRPEDRYLVVPPFFHCFGYKAGWVACLIAGATVLPHAVFDARTVLERLTTDRVTVLPGPPALYQSMLAISAGPVPGLRLAVTGAAVVPIELVERMRSDLGFATVLTAYGLTECSGVATMCRPGDPAERVARTSGRAIDGVEVRVRDGEVQVRGYNVMSGYVDDAVATAEAFTDDGWLRTGDVGELDADGYLRITDRLKDMYVVGGFKAWPAEIEQVILRFPGVRDVAVVGAPDARLGEVGEAWVVGEVDEEALLGFCRERLANYKVPRRVRRLDALPRNASGKVLKRELRERGGVG